MMILLINVVTEIDCRTVSHNAPYRPSIRGAVLRSRDIKKDSILTHLISAIEERRQSTTSDTDDVIPPSVNDVITSSDTDDVIKSSVNGDVIKPSVSDVITPSATDDVMKPSANDDVIKPSVSDVNILKHHLVPRRRRRTANVLGLNDVICNQPRPLQRFDARKYCHNYGYVTSSDDVRHCRLYRHLPTVIQVYINRVDDVINTLMAKVRFFHILTAKILIHQQHSLYSSLRDHVRSSRNTLFS